MEFSYKKWLRCKLAEYANDWREEKKKILTNLTWNQIEDGKSWLRSSSVWSNHWILILTHFSFVQFSTKKTFYTFCHYLQNPNMIHTQFNVHMIYTIVFLFAYLLRWKISDIDHSCLDTMCLACSIWYTHRHTHARRIERIKKFRNIEKLSTNCANLRCKNTLYQIIMTREIPITFVK